MRRVGIVCGAGMVSGKEIMALELAAGLKQQGAQVECATAFWGSRDFRERLQDLRIPTHVLRLGFISATLTVDCLRMTSHQLLHWPGLLLNYRRFIRAFEPHRVVHTNWHHVLLLLPLLKPARDIYWVHEIVPDKPQYRSVFRLFERRLGCFVVVSHAVARSLRSTGICPSKIRVIHNGIDDPLGGRLIPPRRHARVRIGIVGQVGRWKGHDDLFEALAIVIESVPSAELHIFGRGTEPYEAYLKAKATALGIGQYVVWHGFVSDRWQIYREMDVCVVPSHFEEPLGMVAVEAAFFEVPVIASRRGGLPEIVLDGETGYLVDTERPGDMAERLTTLLQSPDLRSRMGQRARQRALEHFSQNRMIGAFAEVMRSEA